MKRLRYKIRIDYPTVDEFRDIFNNVCVFNKIDFNDDVFDYLTDKFEKSQKELSCCHPRDLIDQIMELAHFRSEMPKITQDTIDKAWDHYFVD